MTEEPTYEYIKGKGWVPNGAPYAEGRDSEGRLWRVYARLACKGERWDACMGNQYTTPEDYASSMKNYSVVNMDRAAEDQVHDPEFPYAYTLVPVGWVDDYD